MSEDYKAGLSEDELSQFPSAANPLTAMGLDPDEIAAHPELLAGLDLRNSGSDVRVPYRDASPVSAPTDSSSSPTPPSAAPAVASEAEPTDAEGYGLAVLQRGYRNLESAAKSADEMSTEPPPDLARLTAQREKLAMKAPLFDPSTGKPLSTTQEYDPETGKMVSLNPQATRGQKVWRGVRGGLIGLATGGIPGAVVGAVEPQDIRGGTAYNAPSKAYTQAEERREQALEATDTGIKNALQTWKDVNEARKAKAGEYRAAAGQDKDIVTGATGLINAENKPDKEDKAAISQKEFDQRGQQADRLGLKGPQRTLYIANGKLPDPRQATSEELALAAATRAFRAQYGRDPGTLEEINQVAQSAKGNLGAKEDTAAANNLRTAARLAEQRLKGLQDLTKSPMFKYGTPEQKKPLQDQLDQAQKDYDDLQTQLTSGKKAATLVPSPAAPAPAAPKPTTPAPAPVAPKPPSAAKNQFTVNVPPSAAKNQFTVNVPNVGPYNFPTQQAADQFKRAAGIQ